MTEFHGPLPCAQVSLCHWGLLYEVDSHYDVGERLVSIMHTLYLVSNVIWVSFGSFIAALTPFQNILHIKYAINLEKKLRSQVVYRLPFWCEYLSFKLNILLREHLRSWFDFPSISHVPVTIKGPIIEEETNEGQWSEERKWTVADHFMGTEILSEYVVKDEILRL